MTKFKKYSREQQLYEPWKNAGLIKGKKTLESSKSLGARVAALGTKTENSSKESLFANKKPKANNRNNPAVERMRNGTRQSCKDT